MHGLRSLAVVVVGMWMGCGGSEPPAGSVSVTISAPELPPATPGLARVLVTVSAEDLVPSTLELTPTLVGWLGTLPGIPAGSGRSVQVQAFDVAGVPRFQGRVDDLLVARGEKTRVSLRLHGFVLPAFHSEAPRLEAVEASQRDVVPGGSVLLTARVRKHHPGDTLRYQWSAPSGRFDAPTEARTLWTAPANKGPVSLSLTVSDALGAVLTTHVPVKVSAGWTPTGGLNSTALFNLSTLLADGRVLLTKGRVLGGVDVLDSMIYDPASGRWRAGAPLLETLFGTSAPVPLRDGRVFFWNDLGASQVYDPVSDSWRRIRGSRDAPSPAKAVSLSDGRVLVVGVHPRLARDHAQVYDPVSDTWSDVAVPLHRRSSFSLTLLADGRVLRAGGESREGFVLETEVYDPLAETWSAAGSLSEGRQGHTAVRLLDGRVLLMGGGGERFSSPRTTELYEPVSGTWSVTGSTNHARRFQKGALLPDGRVLVSGGEDSYDGSLNQMRADAETYDPLSGTWRMTAPMLEARMEQALIPLHTGQVLAVGGRDAIGFLDSAELYTP